MVTVEQTLLNIALNLTTNLANKNHYQHIVEGIEQVFPCDACALFLLDKAGYLKPVAIKGIAKTVLDRRFYPKHHPRLQTIIESKEPVRFDANSPLPDPFDGSLLNTNTATNIHDCLGCSLYVEGDLVGVLTLDALTVGAFDTLNPIVIQTFAALAAATMRNIAQFECLKEQNIKQKSVTETLIKQQRSQKSHMVGNSPIMAKLKANIAAVAKSDYAVLISGETGTGKELVAHSIHAQSLRANKPMIYVNCAALPENLAESELFGHIKGAFTGANTHRSGKFELADGGTIFLDEIGELPLSLQAKFLRVIQQGELQRVGSDKRLLVDVRIIAATNRDLEQEVANGNFRADLFHRLNVFPINVPPLKQRIDDVEILIEYFLRKLRHQFNVPQLAIHSSALAKLANYSWPGNIRELEHTLTRAALHSIQDGVEIIDTKYFDLIESPNDVKSTTSYLPNESKPLRNLVEQYQKQLISHALARSNGTWSKAAEFLHMDRGNLYRMGKKFGL